jgi:hypothetical protein
MASGGKGKASSGGGEPETKPEFKPILREPLKASELLANRNTTEKIDNYINKTIVIKSYNVQMTNINGKDTQKVIIHAQIFENNEIKEVDITTFSKVIVDQLEHISKERQKLGFNDIPVEATIRKKRNYYYLE